MIVLLVISAFVLILAFPAIDYSIDEAIVRTPGLNISNSWRASAVAVAAVLIALFSLLRLLVISPSRAFLATRHGSRRACLHGSMVDAAHLHGVGRLQSSYFLRPLGRCGCGGGRPDCFRLRHCHRRICRAGDSSATQRDRQSHG